ncbi:MAG: hypothetical protein GXY89_01745 [Tissierellia bacterium]|jgi:hypothetical protein|nr:hypothetical protein [Tissierellia bacterium]
MQYNVYFIELLGEENLKGVTIPVVVDNRRTLTNENMSDIGKILNTYRTVFVRSNVSDILKTKVYSVKGETTDCLYASVAAVYTLTESNYIREMESGERYITLDTETCKNKISITYGDMTPIGITHEINLENIKSKDKKDFENYSVEMLESTEELHEGTKFYYTEDSMTFSALRKKKMDLGDVNQEYLIVYYDREFDMVFFHVERCPMGVRRLDSRTQISYIVRYLLNMGIEKEKISKICHVLNTGQYAILDIDIEEDKIFIKMNARTLVEGILNI